MPMQLNPNKKDSSGSQFQETSTSTKINTILSGTFMPTYSSEGKKFNLLSPETWSQDRTKIG